MSDRVGDDPIPRAGGGPQGLSASRLRGVLDGTYAGGYTVAAPSGVSATDSAAVQAAHDALPATGGTITLQRGTYDLTAGVTFTKPTVLAGQGMGDFTATAPTRVICSSATATPITLNSAGCQVRDLAVVNTNGGTPSAGAGILVSSGDALRLTRVKTLGFYNNVSVTQGRYQGFTDCLFFDPVNYGLYLQNTTSGQFDFGDISVMGCTFAALTTSRVAAAACRWESGGGLRFVNNKTNGNYNTLGQSQTVGLSAAVADGGSTSVLIVEGNSLEGISAGGAPIVVTQSGTGTGSFSKVVIKGNETLAGGGIRVVGLAANKITSVVIEGNVITGSTCGVYLKNIWNVTVGRNRHNGLTSGAPACWVDTGCNDYVIEPQDVDGTNTLILRDDSAVTTSNARMGNVATYVREITSTTSSVTYTSLWQLQFNAYTSAVVDITLTGQVAGLGSFVYRAVRAVTQAAAGTTPTVATVGTDTATANAPTVQIDVATNQTLNVNIRLPGSGSNVIGQASVRVDGIVSRVLKV